MAPPAPGIPAVKWSRNPAVRAQQVKNPNYRPSAAAQHLERQHGKGGKPHGKPPQHTPSHHELGLQEMNQAQLKHFVTKQVQQATKTELQPYQRRGQELGSEEQGTVGRYNALGAANQQLIGGIQSGAEASAKTFGNRVAEQTKAALGQNESTGQALAERGGGSTDPMLRAQEAAQRRQIEGTGQAAQVAAEQSGQAENSYLANLRAAAVQRMSEGTQGIQTGFAKRKAENQAKESELLGRQPERITKSLTELTQKQFNNRATEAGLKVKLTGLQQKAQEGAASRGQKETASQRTAATARRGQDIGKEIHEQDRVYKETHGPGSKPGKAPKAPSPAEGRKYEKEVSRAEQIAREHLGKQIYNRGRQEAVRKYLSNAYGANADLVSAALNLAVYGKLGPQDRKTAEAYGLNGHMRPQWWGH